MLTVAEVRTIIEDVAFHANWTFEVHETQFESPHINIVGRGLLDSYDPDQRKDVGVRDFLPPFHDASQLLDWLAWRLERIASHEVREHFVYRGCRVFDPHDLAAAS